VPELLEIDAMLGRFFLADKNHRNIPAVALLQVGIVINIDFAKDGAEFAQKRSDGRLGFVAEVASGAGVKSDVPGAGSGKAGVFGMSAHRLGVNLHLTGEQAPLGRTRHNNKAVFAKRSKRRDGAKWEES